MRVRVLGGLEVEGIAEHDLASRKGRVLLGALALARGRPVSTDRLAEVLWGDDQPARPANQVGVLVSRLRGVLGADRIVRSDAGYALAPSWSDIVELRSLAATAAEAAADGRHGAARAAAAAALALVRGPVLPQEDGAWVDAEREAVAAEVGRLRRIAVDAAVAAGDHDAAVAEAEQALAADPYDEDLLRALMQAHLDAARPASALAAYARSRHRLLEDLGVSPGAATEALHARALAAADAAVEAAGSPPGLPGVPGVVGRDQERAALDRALAAVEAGGAGAEVGVVVIEGDAGIGKTTLADTWARGLGDRAVVLRGRCDELGRDLPLQPVTDALADHLRMVGPDRAAELVGAEAAALAPLLGPVAGSLVTIVSEPETGRARMFAALAAVVGRLDPARPVVLVVDDLHLADPATPAWLTYLRRRGERALVVATARPGGAEGVDATLRLPLGPLGLDAVADLVGPDRAAALYERSDGHPLLLAALRDSPGDDLPSSLVESVTARVDSLGADVAATLRVAAVLGHECDLELLGAVLDVPIVAVLGQVESAARVGLVREEGSGFAFRHELVREALVATTGAARRSVVHRVAAQSLAARPDADPLAVAVHAREGGDRVLASTWFVTAGEAAAARFDLVAAEEHLAEAIALAPTAAAHVARARVRMSGQAHAAAAEDAAAAIALDGGAPALEVAGWIAYYRRRFADAGAYAEAAADRADGAAVRGSALALAGRVRHSSGDLDGALEHLAAVGGAPPAVRGVADVWLAQVRNHQGRPVDALAALAGPMVAPDALAHPWAPLHLRFNRVLALGQLGRVGEALAVVDELDALVEREGAVGERFRAPAANIGAWVLRWTGRGEEADERNRRAVEATGSSAPSAEGFAEGHYAALLDLADGCLLRGDTDGAAVLLARLAPVDTWAGTMAWHQRHRLHLLRARLALAGGDADGAAEQAALVADDAARRGAGRYELLARAVAGCADPSIPDGELVAVVDGLAGCAALDGWPLVADLARARPSGPWRARAESMAAVVVAAAGDDGAAARFADGQLRG